MQLLSDQVEFVAQNIGLWNSVGTKVRDWRISKYQQSLMF